MGYGSQPVTSLQPRSTPIERNDIVNALGICPSSYGVDRHGLVDHGNVYWNLPAAQVYEHTVRASLGTIAANGALVVNTGQHTGRSPNDKFIVEEPSSKDDIWWGKVNRPISEANFDRLLTRVQKHFVGRDLFVRDCFAGADPDYRLPIRVINESAWHNYFAACLFICPEPGSTADHVPEYTILNAPSCMADPKQDGTNSEAFIVVHPGRKIVLIGGTAYAGEIKKSIFTIMNYLLPKRGVLSMHCSANVGEGGDLALFFGLSGTGKTTLSADPERGLIGDDEHGWSDTGVFNIEGGCYAKCIRLSEESEPEIYRAIRFGTVLENVDLDPESREIDFDSISLTENTRAAYPLEYIDNAVIPSVGPHPKSVIFLTCDAFGVLPPVARLSPAQAMYHFLSGYTAKVAGTEEGVTEPQATFSACFGAPFLPLPPTTYATMLGEKLARHEASCWLINTGWSGGGYGVGKRMNIHHTRAMVRAALNGDLAAIECKPDPIFGVNVPTSCPGVPSEVLVPRNTWKDQATFDRKAKELAHLFTKNFATFAGAGPDIVAAGPRV